MFRVKMEPINCISDLEVSLADDRQHVVLFASEGWFRESVLVTLTPTEANRLADMLRMVAGMAVEAEADA